MVHIVDGREPILGVMRQRCLDIIGQGQETGGDAKAIRQYGFRITDGFTLHHHPGFGFEWTQECRDSREVIERRPMGVSQGKAV